jgi:hypothetical protein
MKAIWEWIKSLFGGGSSKRVAFATDFLYRWNGGNCPLFLFSEATTDDQAKACVRWLRDGGYTVVTPYFFNDRDGDGRHPVDVRGNVETVKRRLKMCADAGLKVFPILFADDSGRLTGQSVSALTAMAHDAVARFKKSLAGVCCFLEPNELNDDGKVHAVGNAIKAMGLHTAIHTSPVMRGGKTFDAHQVRFGKASWCDSVWVQTSHPNSPVTTQAMQEAIRGTFATCPGKKVIMFEYAFDRPQLGDLAIATGVDGIGNEASRGAIEKLPRWV